MSARGGVFQPVGQKRLTNIAIVRLKKNGLRFEIACYQNKVRDWRSGIEKDLDEVLQSETVFHNVGKGILAKDKELQEAFGTTENRAVCLEILTKGELQVSDKERKVEYGNLFKDISTVVVEKTVNPETGRPYTVTMIERALKDMHFNVDPKKSAKQQALEVIPQLREKFPIERARMRLRVTAPAAKREQLTEILDELDTIIESTEHTSTSSAVIIQVEPGAFRGLHQKVQSSMGGRGGVEVLAMAVTVAGLDAGQFAVEAAPVSKAPTVGAPAPMEGGEVAAAVPKAAPSPVKKDAGGKVLYARGPIADLPESYASRRERFAELDTFQEGWQVELKEKGDTVEAVFFSPSGEQVGAYANARRAALAARKAAGA